MTELLRRPRLTSTLAPLAALACLAPACRAPRGLEDGPRLRQDLSPAAPPHLAAHGFARYSGEQRYVSEGMDTRLVHVPGVFETLVRRYRHPGGAEIRLVATIHFGRPPYYAALRQELAPCRLVLYEDARGFSQDKDGQNAKAPAPFEGLESQRDGLPIGPRWRRADLDGEAIRRHLKAVGASPPSVTGSDRPAPRRPRLLLHWAGLAFADVRPGGLAPVPIPPGLYRLGAKEFARRSERDGPSLEDYALIYRRNDAVIAAVREALEEGAEGPVGLVYGAAHGFDLDDRLKSELGCVIIDERWVRVWSCREDEGEESS